MEIAVKHLCKSFGGRTVLRDLTFTAGPGITAVMAPSGTGKTTLLRILLGLERPDSGTVEGLAGKRLTAVFQEDRLLEHLSAEGNLRFVLGRVYDPAAARALLDRLGLEDGPRILNSYPFELSGGMQQRVGIAAAMLLRPRVLLADEPTAALDVSAQKQVLEELLLVRESFGTAVVLVSHNLGLVAAMADRVLVMRRGEIVEAGETRQVLRQPRADYTRRLLEAVPKLRRA